jgi:hypothetical protein
MHLKTESQKCTAAILPVQSDQPEKVVLKCEIPHEEFRRTDVFGLERSFSTSKITRHGSNLSAAKVRRHRMPASARYVHRRRGIIRRFGGRRICPTRKLEIAIFDN